MTTIIYPGGTEREVPDSWNLYLGREILLILEGDLQLESSNRITALFDVIETTCDGKTVWVEKHPYK